VKGVASLGFELEHGPEKCEAVIPWPTTPKAFAREIMRKQMHGAMAIQPKALAL